MNSTTITNAALPEELAAIPQDYFSESDQPGTLVELEYDTYESMTYDEKDQVIHKRAIVYLPYGYSEDMEYNVFYLMHGGWSDETTYLGTPEQPSEFKNVLDNAMADVEDGTFRYADNEREGNLCFLEQEGGVHSGEYAYVTFNIRGRDSHVIELLTESTPDAYKAYLREKGVSYIIAGKEELDCQAAMEKLYNLFHIKKLLLCGGGIADWTFLSAGMVDELSLLLAPVTDGSKGNASLFTQISGITEGAPIEFTLKKAEPIGDNGLYLNYLAKNAVS